MRKDDRYLLKRGTRWYYMRRVPERFRSLEGQRFKRAPLKTQALEIARLRRDALEAADDDYWASILLTEGTSDARSAQQQLHRRYKAACARVL